jgi:hypothetical protein
MSKLPNAPLIEVIFELFWTVNTTNEQEKFQFLLGDMYSKLKNEYPKRVSLVQTPITGLKIPFEMFVNNPTYRFIKNDSYPLYQIGPGILSVNTVDNSYDWEEFEKEIKKIVTVFSSSYEFEPNAFLNIALKYIDFYKFNFTNDAYAFLKENLHLNISHNICPTKDENPIFFSFGTGYKNDIGQFNIIINKGGINEKGEGFVVETNVVKTINSSELNTLPSWLNKAHSVLSDNFKNMTKGQMYQSFK